MRFRDHPGLAVHGIESYIAVPLRRRSGEVFGTLCALDARPAALSEQHLPVFHLLADLIAFQLEAEDRGREREAQLLSAREAAELREDFVAVLGHDLRNPLQAIVMSTHMLLHEEGLPEARGRTLRRIADSAGRISRMVRDLLDFTRGRLGGVMAIEPRKVDDIVPRLEAVAQEVQTANPGREVRVLARRPLAVTWDVDRMSQVASNLIGNAVQHSPAGTPVTVLVEGAEEAVCIAVNNLGPPIPEALLPRIFEPFHRGARGGLGLGLHIARSIVDAHGGTIAVRTSAAEGTSFTVKVPADAAGG